jgi:hypothetical protein
MQMDGTRHNSLSGSRSISSRIKRGKSIALPESAMVPWAREWARVRAASPVTGYATLEEAVASLKDFLG